MIRSPKFSLMVCALVALSAACSGPTRGSQPHAQVLLSGAGKLGGCAIGELDPAGDGPEIACVGSDGRVHVVSRRAGQWVPEVADQVPGEQIQLALGEIGPERRPGIVSVGVAEGGEDDGGAGVAWLIRPTADGWERQLLQRDDALLHAVAIGDVDPAWPGNEVVLAGFSRRLYLVNLLDGEPVSRVVGQLEGNAKGLALGLGGIVVACDDGSLMRFSDTAAGWASEVLIQHEAPLARISGQPSQVVYCGNDGVLRLWRAGRSRLIYTSSDRLRGALFVSTPKGPRLASAGYDGQVRLHSTDDLGQRVLFSDSDKLHNLAVGQLDGAPALVSCGYSGNLLLMGLR